MKVAVDGCKGMGDNLYQRPAIIGLSLSEKQDVYLRTPWPELYWDVPQLRFLEPKTSLRTQRANVSSIPKNFWSREPDKCRGVRLRYGRGESPPVAFARQCGVEYNGLGGLPVNEQWFREALELLDRIGLADRPFAMVRPPTIRREWRNESRNPEPGLMQALVTHLDLPWIEFGWLSSREEWLAERPLIGTAHSFMHGELRHTTIAALMRMAEVTAVSPSFALPMGIMTASRTFVVWGGYQSPAPLVGDGDRGEALRLVVPDRGPCNCLDPQHSCDRSIDRGRLLEELDEFVEG